MTSGRRALAHTADEGFEAWGPTFADACGEAALALFDAMGRPADAGPREEFECTAVGLDREDAVVRLLTRLLQTFELEGRQVDDVLAASATEESGGIRVALRLRGRRVDRREVTGLTEIKAVTYHGLRVADAPDRVELRVYLDL